MGGRSSRGSMGGQSSRGGRSGMGEREFVFCMALMTAMAALGIDLILPAFADMRPAFGLADDSTRLSLAVTFFFFGSGVGNLFFGPMADALGRKPVLLGALALYAASALSSALSVSLTMLLASRFAWGLAAAGPRSLAQAIVRDRFAGDAMARVMALVQAVFFLTPVAAPLIGKALVEVGSWRWVMGFGVVTATAAALWSTRLPETLAPDRRRSLKPATILGGFRSVMANRVTLGYAFTLTFGFGAFLPFLGSTELVFETVFDRAGWFVPYFSVMGLMLVVSTLGASRLLRRVSADRFALFMGSALVGGAALMLAVAVTGGGRPPIGLWLAAFSLTVGFHGAYFPVCYSLALEPMGEMAGTAAATIGFFNMLVGATLASFVDRAIDDTITPIAVGYLGYGSIALLFQLWARTGRTAATTPTPTA